MNALMPSPSASPASSSAHWPGGPCRNPLLLGVISPLMLSSRRMPPGWRPAGCCRLVDDGIARGEFPRLEVAQRRQPAVCAWPASASIRGLYAPSQIPMSWAGAGPRFAPFTW